MKDNIFTIITIVFNDVLHIKKTIMSVLSQNCSIIEYIIVDGCSTDGTVEIIKKLRPQIERKCKKFVFITEPDKGISDAFNKGINHASGDIIGLINSGDGLIPDTINFLNGKITEEDDIVYGKTLAVDEKFGLEYLREIPSNVDMSKVKYNGLCFTHQSAFVKKRIYDMYGMYDLNYRYIMDTDLFIRFYESGVKFRYIDSVLVSMLCGGISSYNTKKIVEEKIRLSKKYNGASAIKIWIEYYKEKPIVFIKNLIRRYPEVFYKLIGEERRWHIE